MNTERNGYSFMKQWFDFASENSNIVTPVHAALYFWLIQLNNSLNWKEKFGVPTYHTMEMLGIKNYRTYKKAFNDLHEWNFFKLLTKSTNQHTANVIALVNFTKASPKQIPKQVQSTATIDKPIETIETNETVETPKGGLHQKILSLFLEVFNTYVITDHDKELEAAAKLSEILKQTEINTEDALRKFFVDCSNISDNWIRTRITLPFIAGDFNRVQYAIAADKKPTSGGGKSRSGGGSRAGGYRNEDCWSPSDRGLKPGTSPDLKDVDTDNYLNLQ